MYVRYFRDVRMRLYELWKAAVAVASLLPLTCANYVITFPVLFYFGSARRVVEDVCSPWKRDIDERCSILSIIRFRVKAHITGWCCLVPPTPVTLITVIFHFRLITSRMERMIEILQYSRADETLRERGNFINSLHEA